MKKSAFVLFALLALCLSQQSVAQIPRVISYQGILNTGGKPFTGDTVLVFKLYHGIQIGWTSSPLVVHVENGLFGVMLGPFPNEFTFDGIDSLGISLNGSELSPRVAMSASPYSMSSFHSIIADSARNPGPQGPKGDSGRQGFVGMKGDSGAVGSRGSVGMQGPKGDSGAIGPKGLQGNTGSQGSQGPKGDTGAIGPSGLQGQQGSQGSKGDSGSQGVKGDKGVNPLSSTVLTDGQIVFSLNNAVLVRTGVVTSLRLENNTSPVLNVTYSAFWHTTDAVGTSTGTVAVGTPAIFDVSSAYQFSIMLRVGSQWGKIDLFRVAVAPTDWYGSSTSN